MTATAAHGSIALDSTALRRAFSMFPSGVAAVCATIDGRPVGMAASTFVSVSLDPPLVSVCIANSSATWELLRGAGRLGISVLGEAHGDVARQLAGPEGTRFNGLTFESDGEALLLHDTSLWAVCTVEQEIAAGDHVIVVLRVHRAEPHPEIEPIVFHASAFRLLAG